MGKVVDTDLLKKFRIQNDERMNTADEQVLTDAKDYSDNKIGDLSGLNTTSKGNVVEAINNAWAAIAVGGTGSVVSVDTSVTTDGYLNSYTFYQGADDETAGTTKVKIGTIDIPKDLVVTSGTVVQLAEGEVADHAAGTYIKLVVANQANPLYVNVTDLYDDEAIDAIDERVAAIETNFVFATDEDLETIFAD